jgi:hypothetical protein
MKKQMEKSQKCSISYHAVLSLHFMSAVIGKDKHTRIERVFNNNNPLLARKEAFEFLEIVRSMLYKMDQNGFIDLTSPSQAQARKYKNCLAHSYNINFIESEEDVEESITDNSDPEYLAESLGMEYHSYLRLGYDVAKTIKYQGETVLDTPKTYIG